jgi:hypothetical protein
MKRKILPLIGLFLGLGVTAFGLWGCSSTFGTEDDGTGGQSISLFQKVKDVGDTASAIGAATGNPILLALGGLITGASTYFLSKKNAKTQIQAYDAKPFTAEDVASIEAAKAAPKA